MVELTQEPIDSQRVLGQVTNVNAGAVVLFLGTTRQFTRNRETASLDYEAYPDMAVKQLTELESAAKSQWKLTECVLVHRLGHLQLGEASVAVAVSAPHREAAFAAGKWLIDTIKETVPIWKKENWVDGSSEWLHPDAGIPQVTPGPQESNGKVT